MTVLLRGWLLAGCLGVLAAGQSFPTTQVETLAGGKLSIPQAFGGKPVILVWSFSKKAGEATRAWIDPLAREGLPVWSAAMLEAAPRFVRPMIRGGMRKDMPQAQQQRALLFYQGEQQWRQILKPPKDDDPLVVLLDGNGSIAWTYAGVYERKVAEDLVFRLRGVK